jgi:hypothetical protein
MKQMTYSLPEMGQAAEAVSFVTTKNESEQSHFVVAAMEVVNPGELQIKYCSGDVQMRLGDVLQTLVVVQVVSESPNHF